METEQVGVYGSARSALLFRKFLRDRMKEKICVGYENSFKIQNNRQLLKIKLHVLRYTLSMLTASSFRFYDNAYHNYTISRNNLDKLPINMCNIETGIAFEDFHISD